MGFVGRRLAAGTQRVRLRQLGSFGLGVVPQLMGFLQSRWAGVLPGAVTLMSPIAAVSSLTESIFQLLFFLKAKIKLPLRQRAEQTTQGCKAPISGGVAMPQEAEGQVVPFPSLGLFPEQSRLQELGSGGSKSLV